MLTRRSASEPELQAAPKLSVQVGPVPDSAAFWRLTLGWLPSLLR